MVYWGKPGLRRLRSFRLGRNVRAGALINRRLFGGLRLSLPALDGAQHAHFDHVGHGCHHQAHQPSLDTPKNRPLRNFVHDVNSELSGLLQPIHKITALLAAHRSGIWHRNTTSGNRSGFRSTSIIYRDTYRPRSCARSWISWSARSRTPECLWTARRM
jgi:hypothetical protein